MILSSPQLLRFLFYPVAWVITPSNLVLMLVFDGVVGVLLILFEDKLPKNRQNLLTFLTIFFHGIIAPSIAYSTHERHPMALVLNLLVVGMVPNLAHKLSDIIQFIIINAVAWGCYTITQPLNENLLSVDGSLFLFGILLISLSNLWFAAKGSRKLKNEIKLAKSEAKEKEEQSDILLKFSHELRNPLNALIGSLELANSLARSEEMKENLKSASLSSEFLLHMANNLLDSHKLKTEKLVLNPQTHDIFRYIESFWGMISVVIQKNGIDGMLRIGKSVPRYLEFDKHRLTQILFNLTSNALKFTRSGFIKINFSFVNERDYNENIYESIALDELYDDVGTEHITANAPKKLQFQPSNKSLSPKNGSLDVFYTLKHDTSEIPFIDQEEHYQLNLTQKHFLDTIIQEKAEESEGFLRIEVIDTGCGMTPEQSQKLFTKFGQVSDDIEMRQKGTGLGLWITKELCKLMGGDINVSSFKGVGTSFVVVIRANSVIPEDSIKLPLMRASKQKSFSEKLGKDLTSKHQRIPNRVLIADDTVYSQDVVRKLFEKAGVKEVLCVSNGKEALDEYKAREPNYFDFLVLDVNMPIVSGIAAAEEIRKYEQSKELENIPIVFLTGETSEKMRRTCLDKEGSVRGFKYIVKPLLYRDVQEIISEIGQKSSEEGSFSANSVVRKISR